MAVLAKIKKKIKGLIHKVNGNMTVMEALNASPAASMAMRKAISLWASMYENNPGWLKNPTRDDPVEVVSIGLPAAIASEKARMATLELKSDITSKNNKEKADFLNASYQCGLISEIRKQSEYAIAKGGLVITPYPIIKTDKKGNDRIDEFAFDFVQADRFIPISFDSSNKITDAAFLIRKETVDYIYYRLERHSYKDGDVTITNRAFKKENRNNSDIFNIDIFDVVLGAEIGLGEVPEWSSLEKETTIENVKRVLFGYLKMPCANTIDEDSPLGVSGYSRAVDLIRQADIQHARLEWELKAGMMRIDCDQEAFRDHETTKLMSSGDIPLEFRLRDTNDSTSYNIYAPDLRVQEYIDALENTKAMIEDACALSRGTLSQVTDQARTATELKILRQRTYSENADIQQAIQKALEDVVYAMNVHYCIATGSPQQDDDCQVSFEFDDSIIVDREAELQQRLTLMDRGLAGEVENRMWYFGETEEQATAALDKIHKERARNSADKLDNMGDI